MSADHPDLFDAAGSRAARDEGIALVTENAEDWMGRALVEIAGLPAGWAGLGEDFRAHVERRIGPAHHSNATGALINNAARLGLICKTGQRRKMRLKRSHARETPEWRRVGALQ